MRTVGVAELKNRLSEYLRRVRRGEAITVLDRDTPVAQLGPVGPPAGLVVRSPAAGSLRPGDVPLPPPLRLHIDVDRLLAEERGDR